MRTTRPIAGATALRSVAVSLCLVLGSAHVRAQELERTKALAHRTGSRQTARLSPEEVWGQVTSRVKTLTVRALTAPAQVWPMTKVAQVLCQGEPLAGRSTKNALEMAGRVQKDGHATTIGRLSLPYRDVWSVREAEGSFMRLVDRISAAKRSNAGFDASIAFDPDSFGLQLLGLPQDQRQEIVARSMLKIARRAKAKGVPIEMDMTTSAAMPYTIEMARRIVTELKVPVRLALSARYLASAEALRAWADLARSTGIKLGVRLVKGSYVEADAPGTIHERGPLLAQYRTMITMALERSGDLDVAVATQNEEIWRHAQSEARRLDGKYAIHVIRGVNEPLQQKMRAEGEITREYISYGPDAPAFGLAELWTNWREARKLEQRGVRDVDW